MSPGLGKSHYRTDVGKVDELFVDHRERHQELDSDEELEAALRRELIELSSSSQPLGPEAVERWFNETA